MSILPEAIRDTNNLALEECTKLALDIDMKDFMIYPLEGVQEKLLPYLAKENCVTGWEGWNLCSTTKEKRNLIINSFIKHAKKGTLAALKEVLDDFNIQAVIQEFWEYGGRAGHYIVKFLGVYERTLTDEFKDMIFKIIKTYAPASRILDYVNYVVCSKATIYVSSYGVLKQKTVIKTEGEVI